MRAMAILRQSFEKSLTFMHLKRCDAFWSIVAALLIGGRLAVTGLGRAAPVGCAPKHAIKKVDRLLSNPHLRRELPGLFGALARFLVANHPRAILLVDWSSVGADNLHEALVASVAMAGRSLVIYAEVYPQSECKNPHIERRFLTRLKAILPEGCRPVVVTDAGFRMPWFDAVAALGWDFVGRLTSYTSLRSLTQPGAWFQASELYALARRHPTDLGDMVVRRGGPRICRVVVAGRRRSQGRKRLTRRGKRSRRSTHLAIENRARQPWVLVTSLRQASTKHVLSIYRLRMQIEETFRDLKSHRFGWSFADTRSGAWQRLQVLLLLAAFAALATVAVGCALEQGHLHRLYQANTVKNRRVLSLFYLGKIAIDRHDDDCISPSIMNWSYQFLRLLIARPLEQVT